MTGIEGYQLVRRIGAGGMGAVHEAVDADGRRVAIKILHDSIAADPSARRRLRREVDLLHRVRDDRVARVLDAEVDGEDAFVVTELIDGPTLDEYVRTSGPLGGTALAELADGLAGGLHAIHTAGITHRDLKPGNVMLAPTGPMIIDFGIAQVADDVRLTQTGMITGTPGYLDPDVIAGADPGAAGDWWAWAAVLAFAATGRPPFGRGSMAAVLARVSTGVVDTDGLPEVLARALRAALDPEPRRRLAPEELLAVIDGEWDLDMLAGVLGERPPARATRALAAPAALAGETPVAATRSLPAVRPDGGVPPAAAAAASPYGAAPPAIYPPSPMPSGEYRPAAYGGPGDLFAPSYPMQAGYPPMLQERPAWAVSPARRTLTSALVALAFSGLATTVPGVWALLLAGLLVTMGAVGHGGQRLRAGRMRRGLRRGDVARAWLAAPWHLLWAAVAALPGLLIGGVIGGGVWWAVSAVAEVPQDWAPWVLWVAAVVVTLLAWTVPPSHGAREGSRLLLGALPQPVRLAVGILAVVAVAVLAGMLLLGHVGEPVWDPLPAVPMP